MWGWTRKVFIQKLSFRTIICLESILDCNQILGKYYFYGKRPMWILFWSLNINLNQKEKLFSACQRYCTLVGSYILWLLYDRGPIFTDITDLFTAFSNKYISAKFHQDSFQTERLIRWTDRHCKFDSYVDA